MYFAHQMERFRNARRGAVLLLLLCAMNVAGLFLTRDTQVRKEMALQSALGARRRRILSRLVLENLLVALGGAVLGVCLAILGTRHLSALGMLPPITFHHQYLEPSVLIVVFGGSLALGLLVSLAPIRQIFRSDLHGPLKSDLESAGPGVRRVMKSLTVAEVALVTLLLAMTAVQSQNYLDASFGDPGYETDSLLTVQLEYRDPGYHTPEGAGSFVRNLLTQAETWPGIEAAALAARWTLPTANMATAVVIEGRDEGGEIQTVLVYRQYVTPGFFDTAEIGLREGRDFTYQDAPGSPPVVIINQAFADRHWPDGDAVGSRVQLQGGNLDPNRWWTIVGVTEETFNRGLYYTVTRDQDVYIPLLQKMQPSGYLFVRTAGDPSPLIPDLRRQLRQLDEEAAVNEIQTVRQRMKIDAQDDRFIGATVLYFSLIALIVAMIGLYATLAFMVRRRTREIGVRMALGASRSTILRMTALQALKLVVAGIALGCLLCFAFSRFVFLEAAGFAGLTDPRLLGGITALLLLVSVLAIWVPVRYATRVQPVQALRYE
jgi:putative ABC transport system permease protein